MLDQGIWGKLNLCSWVLVIHICLQNKLGLAFFEVRAVSLHQQEDRVGRWGTPRLVDFFFCVHCTTWEKLSYFTA